MRLNLAAFTVSQLQTSLALLRLTDDLHTLCTRIEEEVTQRAQVSEVSSSHKVKNPCPSPGCDGVLTRWPTSSKLAGVPIIGCSKCRYSQMEINNG